MKALQRLFKTALSVTFLSITISSCSTPESEITPIESSSKFKSSQTTTVKATDSLRAFIRVREFTPNGNGGYTMHIGKASENRVMKFDIRLSQNNQIAIYNFFETGNDTVYQYRFDRIAKTRTFRKAHYSVDINTVPFNPDDAYVMGTVAHAHDNMPIATITRLAASSLNADDEKVPSGPQFRGGEGLGAYFCISAADFSSGYKQVLDFAFALCGPESFPHIMEYQEVRGINGVDIIIKIVCRQTM